jgi:septum formation protein
MQQLQEIILASASPRRRELLASLGLHVIVVPSDIDEGDRPGYGPLELARLHAGSKADAVAAREPGRLLIAADTVVDLDGESLGKPGNPPEAARMLSRLSGREHLVHTAYSIVDGPSGRRRAGATTTKVRFHRLSPAVIDAYVASGDPMDKAGAYGIQGPGAALVEGIDGDFYSVMGLPLGAVTRDLRALGYRLPPVEEGLR